MVWRLAFGLIAVAASLACVTVTTGGSQGHATPEQLKARAAFEMDCAEAKLQVTMIDARTRGVSGCGKKATYVEICEKRNTNCAWKREADFQRAEGVSRQ